MASVDAGNNEIGEVFVADIVRTVYASLASDTRLYRSLTRAGMFIAGAVHPQTGNAFTPLAFMRRAPHPETAQMRDADGFSVTLADGRSEDVVIESEKQ